MKKKNVLNLIRYYAERNDVGFRSEAYEIAKEFDENGDFQLSQYIMALLSNANTFTPQIGSEELSFFRKIEHSNSPLPLPEIIKDEIVGIVNAVNHKAGINKFLFQGAPGTGKTETAKQVARILDRELFIVDFEAVIDSKLGQTAKNIAELFREIKGLAQPDKVIILFDEIDAIAIDRINNNDLREMGRATSAILKGMDNLNENIVLIATTNLFNAFDKALTRRFDAIIDFNRYTREDLIEVAISIMNGLLERFKFAGRNMRLFTKIVSLMEEIPYPGELTNILKTAVAFSNSNDEFDYLKRLFNTLDKNNIRNDIKKMQETGFTVREIELLIGKSKSQVSRELKEGEDSE